MIKRHLFIWNRGVIRREIGGAYTALDYRNEISATLIGLKFKLDPYLLGECRLEHF